MPLSSELKFGLADRTGLCFMCELGFLLRGLAFFLPSFPGNSGDLIGRKNAPRKNFTVQNGSKEESPERAQNISGDGCRDKRKKNSMPNQAMLGRRNKKSKQEVRREDRIQLVEKLENRWTVS